MTLFQIAQLVIGGGLIAAILLHLREWPKARREAQRLRAETENTDWARFQKEIGRLEERLSRVEKENEDLRERLDRQRGRERSLEHENELLRNQVASLEKRLSAIEHLFKTQPLTPEMEAAIARLDPVETPRRRAAETKR